MNFLGPSSDFLQYSVRCSYIAFWAKPIFYVLIKTLEGSMFDYRLAGKIVLSRLGSAANILIVGVFLWDRFCRTFPLK